jgi:hypothetical protein
MLKELPNDILKWMHLNFTKPSTIHFFILKYVHIIYLNYDHARLTMRFSGTNGVLWLIWAIYWSVVKLSFVTGRAKAFGLNDCWEEVGEMKNNRRRRVMKCLKLELAMARDIVWKLARYFELECKFSSIYSWNWNWKGTIELPLLI